MSTSAPAIRLTRTTAVQRALDIARQHYPALDDREIFKLALSRLVTEDISDPDQLGAIASQAVGYDYLADPGEDIYSHLVNDSDKGARP